MESPEQIYSCFFKALEALVKKGGRGTQNVLAIGSDRSEAYISQILKGRRKASFDTQIAIANALNTTYENMLALGRQLIEGTTPEAESPPDEHPLVVNVNSDHEQEFLQKQAEHYRGIPLYESGKLAAGINGLAFDPYEEPASTVIVYGQELCGRLKHNLKALRVGGDSMEPVIPKGSIVVVDLNDREYVDKKIYVVRNDTNETPIGAVKRVRKMNSSFVLLSENREYLPEITELDWPDLCVGRVVWMWRSLEEA